MATKNPDVQEVTKLINTLKKEKIFLRKTEGVSKIKLFVEAEGDRDSAKEKMDKLLKSKGYPTETTRVPGHSAEASAIKGKDITIIYKNKKGGMAETTINSTITELFPCIAFLGNIKETNKQKFYEKIKESNNPSIGCYVNSKDAEKGSEFISSAAESSKFDEKVNNALGILKFLKEQDAGKKIKDVYWGYRAKPQGVMNNHPGDIFIRYTDGKMVGVSLKAGGAGTMEPKLNTYVNPIVEFFGKQSEYKKWQQESYDKYYAGIPGIADFQAYGKSAMVPAIAKFEKDNSKLYEQYYDEQLEWLRDKIIEMMNADQKMVKKFLLEKVAGEQKDVPLVVIKAVQANYQELNDDDIVKECVQRSRKTNGVQVTKSPKSKQTFFVDLICNNKTTRLNFTIRTNKSGAEHKLGQFINLAVKFNGVQG